MRVTTPAPPAELSWHTADLAQVTDSSIIYLLHYYSILIVFSKKNTSQIIVEKTHVLVYGKFVVIATFIDWFILF